MCHEILSLTFVVLSLETDCRVLFTCFFFFFFFFSRCLDGWSGGRGFSGFGFGSVADWYSTGMVW